MIWVDLISQTDKPSQRITQVTGGGTAAESSHRLQNASKQQERQWVETQAQTQDGDKSMYNTEPKLRHRTSGKLDGLAS
jgi:hypothetical protein